MRWMTGHRRPIRYMEVTEEATVEGHRLNTIKTTLNEVKATGALREKCTVVGGRKDG